MKNRKHLILIPFIALLGIFLLSASSCATRNYSAKNKISYNRSDRIKVYKSNSNRKSFIHDNTVRKKYVIKKKKKRK